MSQKLLGNLQFRSLLIPTWFGKDLEGARQLQDAFGDFLNQTLTTVVEQLLDEEPSPEYWYETNPWPYPDTEYVQSICSIIDESVPSDWDFSIRAFYLGWLLQYTRYQILELLGPVHEIRLKRQ